MDTKIVLGCLAIAGSLALISCPLIYRSRKPFWPYLSFGISGLFCFIWGILLLVSLVYHEKFAPHLLKLLNHYRLIAGGVFMGMMLVLFISGNMRLSKKEHASVESPQNRKSSNNNFE